MANRPIAGPLPFVDDVQQATLHLADIPCAAWQRPDLRRRGDAHLLSASWPDTTPANPSGAALAEPRETLREAFFQRYAAIYAAPEVTWLMARGPSLLQWDDHDICDGWGSLPRARSASAVRQALFAAAREAFLLFQHATVSDDLPARFADPRGGHRGWRVLAPGLRLDNALGDGVITPTFGKAQV